MLQQIHDRVHGWVALLIASVIAATFALWGIQWYLHSDYTQAGAATVDGIKITKVEVNKVYERLRRQFQNRMGANFTITPEINKQMKREALSQLIINTVLSTGALAEGYNISEQQLEQALMQIPQFQENGQFSPRLFRQALDVNMYEPTSFMAQLRKDILKSQVRAGILVSAFSLSADVDNAIKLITQKRDISYLTIPIKRFASLVKISKAEQQKYYKEHTNEFMIPEKVSIEYLQLSLSNTMQQFKPSEQELKDYYQDNRNNFKTPAKWRVAHILIRLPATADKKQIAEAKTRAEEVARKITTGENFAALAKKYSDDIASAKKGGELPWITAGRFDPSFERAIIGLTKVNQVSAPVKTKYGYEIVKLLAEKPSKVVPFTQVKARISKILKQQKAQQKFADDNEILANLTYSNPDSLASAAKALKLTIKSTGLFSRQGDKKDKVTSKPGVISTAFSDDVLRDKNNSDVITFDADSVIVLRVKQHLPAIEKPFKQVANSIKQKLLQNKIRQRAQKLGGQILKELQSDKSSQQTASKYQLKWVSSKNLARNDQKVNSLIVEGGFSLPHPSKTVVHPSSGITLANGDYAIVRLLAIREGNLKKFNNQKRKMFKGQFAQSRGMLDYEFYVKGLMKQAKIKRHDDVK